MTIGEYLQNPYGKGSAFSSSTKEKDALDKEIETLKTRMQHKIYRYRDRVIYHVTIPSTKNDKVTYDVIVEVETKGSEGSANIESLPTRFFSNCPSFIFTYAYAFYKRKLLCEWLLNKYDKRITALAANSRNAYQIIGLERSIYLALKYLHINGLTNEGTYQTVASKVSSYSIVAKDVRSSQEIMDATRMKIPKKKEEETGGRPSGNAPRHHSRSAVSATKTTASGKLIKPSKKIKTTRKI